MNQKSLSILPYKPDRKEDNRKNSQICLEHLAILHSLFLFSSQETLEDIDKNGDGFVDQDEYIGECGLESCSAVPAGQHASTPVSRCFLQRSPLATAASL